MVSHSSDLLFSSYIISEICWNGFYVEDFKRIQVVGNKSYKRLHLSLKN